MLLAGGWMDEWKERNTSSWIIKGIQLNGMRVYSKSGNSVDRKEIEIERLAIPGILSMDN